MQQFFSNLAGLLLQKPLHRENKFGVKSAKEYYRKIQNVVKKIYISYIAEVNKILTKLDVSKATRIDEIFLGFLKDAAFNTNLHLANISFITKPCLFCLRI